MSEEDKALEAARLYSNDSTFQDIAKQLEVSKSYAQVLVRRGIDLSIKEVEKSNPGDVSPENPGTHQGSETYPQQPQYPFTPQDPRTGSYMLETTGIGRRVMLTPKCLMIFDLWCGSGFEGDLSDFLEDAVNFLYESRRPAERY